MGAWIIVGLFPQAPAILFLRSDLTFRSDLIFALPCKRGSAIGSIRLKIF